MSWEVRLTRPAQRDLRRLDKQVADRILDALERWASTGHGDIRQLHGPDVEHRLRVGDWRVRLIMDWKGRAIVVLRVQHRREAYR